MSTEANRIADDLGGALEQREAILGDLAGTV
jgi:hypothetical protein